MLLLNFIVVFLSCWPTVFSARIELTPIQFDGLMPNMVNVSCTPDKIGNCEKEKLGIQILRGGQPIANIGQGSSIRYGVDSSAVVKAQGHIEEDVEKCFLRLTMRHIINVDPNTYTCYFYYFNEMGFLVEEKVDDHLITNDEDFQQRNNKFLFQKIFLQQDLIKDQTQKLRELTQQYESLRNEVIVTSEKVSNLERTVKSRTKDIANLTNIGNHAMQHVDALETFIQRRTAELQSMIEHDRYASAFLVGYTRKDKFNAEDVVHFDLLMLNHGNSYNQSDGSYRAPRKGIYAFHLTVMTTFIKSWIGIDIRVNNIVMATTSMANSIFWDHTSTSCVVKLELGDVVNVVIRAVRIKGLEIRSHPFSFFSGHLVKTL